MRMTITAEMQSQVGAQSWVLMYSFSHKMLQTNLIVELYNFQSTICVKVNSIWLLGSSMACIHYVDTVCVEKFTIRNFRKFREWRHTREHLFREHFPSMHVSSAYGAFGQTCQKQLSTSSSQSAVMTSAAQKQYMRQPFWQLRRKRSKHSQK